MFKPGQIVRTRRGQKVEILAIVPADTNGNAIVGLWHEGGKREILLWGPDGMFNSRAGTTSLDLLSEPPREAEDAA